MVEIVRRRQGKENSTSGPRPPSLLAAEPQEAVVLEGRMTQYFWSIILVVFIVVAAIGFYYGFRHGLFHG